MIYIDNQANQMTQKTEKTEFHCNLQREKIENIFVQTGKMIKSMVQMYFES